MKKVVKKKIGRTAKIIVLRDSGLSYAKIGKEVGLSDERVRQILKENGRAGRIVTQRQARRLFYAVGVVARREYRREQSRMHGASRYNNKGCRCEICREAWRVYCWNYRQRRKRYLLRHARDVIAL